MSLEEAVPTLEELRAAKIEELLSGADPSCWAYAMSLLDPKTLPAAGSSNWKARTLVGFVTSLKLDIEAMLNRSRSAHGSVIRGEQPDW
jgi:hypothetical protein